MSPRGRFLLEGIAALAAAVLVAVSVWRLEAAQAGLSVTEAPVGPVPVTVHRPADGAPGPAVVIAHGFAGSRQIMQSFAITLARNGYTAVSFDFAGHGRHPEPMRGDLHDAAGATRNLTAELERVIAYARSLGPADRRVALIGHSMASDIVIRAAQRDREVVATVAVSMFSPALTAEAPRNLLVIVGGWEGAGLKDAAERAVAMAHGDAVEMGRTYGDMAAGTARRAVFAEHAEHVGVLFAGDTLRETVAWLDAAFGRGGPGDVADRGGWIVLLMVGLAVGAWPLSRLLPRVREVPVGAGLSWRGLVAVTAVPAVLTPLILWPIPTDFLTMAVGDYLIAHIALFGLIAALALEATGGRTPWRLPGRRVLAAATLSAGFGVAALALPLDRHFASFVPTGERIWLANLLTAAALPYFLIDDWAARGGGRAWLRLLLSRLLLLASLAGAIALNRDELFFLIILLPMIAVFFLVYGGLSALVYARTGHPGPGAVMQAAALGWAVAVTFPILAGA